MAGIIKAGAVQLGDSATASQNFVWQTNVDGAAKLSRGNVGATTQDILTVDAAGLVGLPTGQLKFPAVQVPSTNINTLDDYREGTWLPSVACAGLTLTTAASGNFVKVGRLVTCSMAVTITSLSGTQTGGFFIGLPFIVAESGVSCAGRENAVAGLTWNGFGGATAQALDIRRYDNTAILANNMSWILSFSYLTV